MLLSCIMFITLLRRLGVGHMEKPYMLTYDLNSPGQKYEELRNVIKKRFLMVIAIIGNLRFCFVPL